MREVTVTITKNTNTKATYKDRDDKLTPYEYALTFNFPAVDCESCSKKLKCLADGNKCSLFDISSKASQKVFYANGGVGIDKIVQTAKEIAGEL